MGLVTTVDRQGRGRMTGRRLAGVAFPSCPRRTASVFGRAYFYAVPSNGLFHPGVNALSLRCFPQRLACGRSEGLLPEEPDRLTVESLAYDPVLPDLTLKRTNRYHWLLRTGAKGWL